MISVRQRLEQIVEKLDEAHSDARALYQSTEDRDEQSMLESLLVQLSDCYNDAKEILDTYNETRGFAEDN